MLVNTKEALTVSIAVDIPENGLDSFISCCKSSLGKESDACLIVKRVERDPAYAKAHKLTVDQFVALVRELSITKYAEVLAVEANRE